MKSKKATALLEYKLARLSEEFAELSRRADEIAEQIKKAGTITFRTHLAGWRGGKIRVSKADIRLSDELWAVERLKGRVHYEMEQVKSLLSPPKGRPKEIDQSIIAAVTEWKNSNPKPTTRALAYKHCPRTGENERQRFVWRLQKALLPYRRRDF